jgi:hypothetical protein
MGRGTLFRVEENNDLFITLIAGVRLAARDPSTPFGTAHFLNVKPSQQPRHTPCFSPFPMFYGSEAFKT